MNVLSLFDGMFCGQIALKELGIEPDIYYASEIDKFAIKQTQMSCSCWKMWKWVKDGSQYSIRL
jgi:hypothetical protein